MNTHSTPQKNEAIYLMTTSKQRVTDTKKKKKGKSAQGEEDFKNKGEVGDAGAGGCVEGDQTSMSSPVS